MDWFKIGKGVRQGFVFSPCLWPSLLNLYVAYIIWNAVLDEFQAGIKTSGRNINNLRYADDTTLVAENEEELKRLVEGQWGSEKDGLKLIIQRTKIMAPCFIISWQIEREKMELLRDFIFLGFQITAKPPWAPLSSSVK